MPRRCKRPRHYEDGTSEPYQPDEPKVYYRKIYFKSIDAAIVTIRDRFNQGDYSMYAKLEQVVLLVAKMRTTPMSFKRWLSSMKEDFNKSELETQLEVFSQMEAAHHQWRRKPFQSDQAMGVVVNGRLLKVKLLIDYD